MAKKIRQQSTVAMPAPVVDADKEDYTPTNISAPAQEAPAPNTMQTGTDLEQRRDGVNGLGQQAPNDSLVSNGEYEQSARSGFAEAPTMDESAVNQEQAQQSEPVQLPQPKPQAAPAAPADKSNTSLEQIASTPIKGSVGTSGNEQKPQEPQPSAEGIARTEIKPGTSVQPDAVNKPLDAEVAKDYYDNVQQLLDKARDEKNADKRKKIWATIAAINDIGGGLANLIGTTQGALHQPRPKLAMSELQDKWAQELKDKHANDLYWQKVANQRALKDAEMENNERLARFKAGLAEQLQAKKAAEAQKARDARADEAQKARDFRATEAEKNRQNRLQVKSMGGKRGGSAKVRTSTGKGGSKGEEITFRSGETYVLPTGTWNKNTNNYASYIQSHGGPSLSPFANRAEIARYVADNSELLEPLIKEQYAQKPVTHTRTRTNVQRAVQRAKERAQGQKRATNNGGKRSKTAEFFGL